MNEKTTINAVAHGQQVLLSAEELAKLGLELLDIMDIIAMNNLVLSGLSLALLKDDTTSVLWLVKQYSEIAYNQNQKINNQLDIISLKLQNSDNEEELEGL